MEQTSRDLRVEVLESADQAINSDRNAQYGDPEDNFTDIATLWNAYMETNKGVSVPLFNALDVAMFMMLLKIARAKTSPTNHDHYVDIAGYAGCALPAAYRAEGR